jgi:site-specific DNA-adenine methylase
MKTKRLVQWFGSNSENAQQAGRLLDGCRFVGIPFAGGMSEVPHITAKQILANDLHRHVINLCRVIADSKWRLWLIKQADAMPYHPDVLQHAQLISKECGVVGELDPQAALQYFIAVWMGRGGKAGTTGEFKGALPIRWNANGGGSNQRYRTAIEALEEWGRTFRRCEFTCQDGTEFVTRFPDHQDNGLFVDAPWPDAGDLYEHQLEGDDPQAILAGLLEAFTKTRVVVRFGEHPLIRRLYPEPTWTWIGRESRDQANQVKPEWLICRNLP